MSLGGNDNSWAPLHRGSASDNLPQFKTYASAAYDLDAINHVGLPNLALGERPLSLRPAFERGEFLQALIDVCAVTAAFLLALVTALGIVFAVFVLLFVKL